MIKNVGFLLITFTVIMPSYEIRVCVHLKCVFMCVCVSVYVYYSLLYKEIIGKDFSSNNTIEMKIGRVYQRYFCF